MQSFQFNYKSKSGLTFLLILVFISSIALYLAYLPQEESYSSFGNIDNELDFDIILFDNSTVSLSEYKGKVILLDFYATWCYPCKLQVPILRDIQNNYPEITIISVSAEINDSYQDLLQYKTENGPMNWDYGKDKGDINGELTSLTKFRIIGYPTIVLINENGEISKYHLGITSYSELSSWIEKESIKYSSVIIYGFELSSSLGIILFFLIGVYIALSPCLFPILPTTIMNIMYKESQNWDSETNKYILSSNKSNYWILSLWSGIVVSFGILIVFSSIIAIFLIQNYLFLNLIFGVVMILIGIVMFVPKIEYKLMLIIPSIPIINKFRKDNLDGFDLFLLGSSYSIIAFPCAGPAILAMLPLLIGSINPIWTMSALIAFSIGILIPYLIIGQLALRSSKKFMTQIQESYKIIKIVTSMFIILIGLLLVWPYYGGPSILTFTN